MKINFKIADKEYQFKSLSHDFVLNEYKGIKESINKDTGDVTRSEDIKHVAYCSNIFEALRNIPDYHTRNSEIDNLKDLGEMYKVLLIDINEVVKQFKIMDTEVQSETT